MILNNDWSICLEVGLVLSFWNEWKVLGWDLSLFSRYGIECCEYDYLVWIDWMLMFRCLFLNEWEVR